jgi:hypothetical protein
MTTWTNSDGLPIEFGTTQAGASTGGHVMKAGDAVELVVDIDLTTLADASATVGFVDEHELPEGAIIRSAKMIVLTAAAGATAVLDVGVIDASADSSGTSDDDGLDAAVAVAALTPAGTEITCDGALINTVLDAHYKIAASYDTAAFTAGKVRLIVEYTPTLNRENQ